jgi:hypothetical protein
MKKMILQIGLLGISAGLLCGCASGGPRGDSLYLAQMERGSKAFEGGMMDAAQQHYEAAFQRALAIDQASDASDAGSNAALAGAKRGHNEDALRLLEAALQVRRLAQLDEPWDMLLLKAQILAPLDTAAAEQTARAALMVADGRNAKNSCTIFLAQLLLANGRVEDAETLFSSLALNSLSAVGRADTATLEADILRQKKQFGEAAAAYEQAAEQQRQAEKFNLMTDCLMRSASAYAQAGNKAAGRQFLRAAQAAYGQRRLDVAAQAVKQAVELAQNADDALLAQQAGVLLELVEAELK